MATTTTNANNTAKLMGSLMFNLAPLEANLRRVDQITRYMSQSAERVERSFKRAKFSSVNIEDIAIQERLVRLKSQEALTEQRIATTKLKNAQAAKINLQVETQRALIQQRQAAAEAQQVLTQQRLASAGQVALRTKQMEADLQNRLAAAENRRLQLATQRLRLEQQMQALQRQQQLQGTVGAGGAGSGSGGSSDYTFLGGLEHRAGWFASSLAFFGSGAVFSGITKAMGEVEMGMVEIARIQEDIAFNTEEMRQAIFNLGREYGQQWSVVQDIALRWSQAGLNVKDTIEATRASLLALNTAELDAQQSTVALIGIMAQWGLEVTELQDLIDKINLTADNFVVTSQDLVDGLLRSSGTARVFGMTIEETIAILTAMQEASGRTGREVGNAFNSIMSFMQRDKALDTFDAMGINVWADETKTNFKNLIEIFDQVAANWDNISDEIKDGFVQAANEAGLFSEEMAAVMDVQEEYNDMQKRDLSQAMAGVYRRNYLLALIQNWSKVQEVLNGVTNAQGYSLRENERTMQAYQKRVESLRVSVTELATAIGDAGLLDIMKDLVDGTREGIEAFRELPEPIQNAIIACVGLTAALAGINLMMRIFMGMGIGRMLIGLAARITGVQAATLGLGAALKILATNPIVLTVTALGALTAAVIAYRNHQAEATERARDAATESISHADNINDLSAKYVELSNNVELTAEQHEELQKTMNELAEIFPDIVSQWDEQGNAIAFNNERLRENIALAREAAAANAMDYYTKAIAKRSDIQEQLRKELSGKYPAYFSGNISGRTISTTDPKKVKELRDKLAQAEREVQDAISMVDRNTSEWGKVGADIQAALSKSSGGGEGDGGNNNNGGGTPDPNKSPTPDKPTSILDQAPADVRNMILYASQVTGVPAEIIAAIAKKESGFSQSARSSAGAIGIMQLMPGTARGLGVDPTSAQENIIGGARYYQQQLTKYGNDMLLALAAYNAGPGSLDKAIRQAGTTKWEVLSKYLPGETREYVPGVLGYLQGSGGGSSVSSDPLAWLVQYEEQLKLLDVSMQKFTLTEQLLTNAIGDQIPTTEQISAAYANWTQHITTLQQRQQILRTENEAISRQIAKTGDTTGELTYKFVENENAILQNQIEIDSLKKKMQDFQDTVNNMKFDQANTALQHWTSMGMLSIEQQIAALRRLTTMKELTIEEDYRMQQQLQSKYRQLISDQLSEVKDTYQKRLKIIEDNYQRQLQIIEDAANAETAIIQKRIDALSEESDLEDREEARRQHEERLKGLQDEYRYHELRTGIEHEEAKADIEKQIAEENRRWELQQQDWQREDEKRNLQKQIDRIKEAAERKKKILEKDYRDAREQLEDYYNDVMKIIDDRTQDMLAAMAVMNDQWYEQGKTWIDELNRGMEDGNLKPPSGFGKFFNDAENNSYASIDPLQWWGYWGGDESEFWSLYNKYKKQAQEKNYAWFYISLGSDKLFFNKKGEFLGTNEQGVIDEPRILNPTNPVYPGSGSSGSGSGKDDDDYTGGNNKGDGSDSGSSGSSNVPSGWVKKSGGNYNKAIWGYVWSVTSDGGIYKDNNYVPASNYQHVPDEVLDVARMRKAGKFAEGGVIDYTGLAWVHGAKQRSEVIFNAEQAKELYMLVKGLRSDRIAPSHTLNHMSEKLTIRVNMSDWDKLAPNIQKGITTTAFDRAVDRIVTAIEGRMGINFDKLINIERAGFEDNQDMQIFSREVARTVTFLARAGGRI